MTKLRKPNTIEFALQNALKNLSEEELKSATDKSKSHFFKCGDPDDQHHTLSITDAIRIDELLLKKSKGTPLYDAISTNLHEIMNQTNYFENINSVLMNIGGRLGDIMDLTESAFDPKSDLGASLSKIEKDKIHKAIALLEEKIKNLKLSVK
tara:strand:- start:535 stop:990 length:456 start_codon:yes stop_codon:yes gene_type:complete